MRVSAGSASLASCGHFPGHAQYGHACDITARPAQVGHDPGADQVGSDVHDGRVRRRTPHGAKSTHPAGYDHTDVEPREIGSKFRQPFFTMFAEAIFDDDVSALDIAKLAQALLEARNFRRIASSRAGPYPADARHLRRLLRTGRDWPRSGAAERCDERATFDWTDRHETPLRGVSRARYDILARLSTGRSGLRPLSWLGLSRDPLYPVWVKSRNAHNEPLSLSTP